MVIEDMPRVTCAAVGLPARLGRKAAAGVLGAHAARAAGQVAAGGGA